MYKTTAILRKFMLLLCINSNSVDAIIAKVKGNGNYPTNIMPYLLLHKSVTWPSGYLIIDQLTTKFGPIFKIAVDC